MLRPLLVASLVLTALGCAPHNVGNEREDLADDGGRDARAFDPPADDAGESFDVGEGLDPGPGVDAGAADAKCASSTTGATPVPLDLFFMLDQSGSMKETTGSGATKWSAIKGAFKSFLADPAAAGIAAGLGYFGRAGFFSDGKSSCAVGDYAKADVPIAALPGVGSSIATSLLLHDPFTDTPTGPALAGALQYARAFQAAHPGHVVSVVLATDGLPTACAPLDADGIAAFAAKARAESPPIRTYVIGVMSDADLGKGAATNLDTISKAGNGAPAFVIKSTGSDVEKAFLSALLAIRGTALPCEYLVPAGVGADYDKVNVRVTRGATSTTLPYVERADKCGPAGGWYYDVPPPGKPTRVLTCPATCKALTADGAGKVDIEIGCATLRPK